MKKEDNKLKSMISDLKKEIKILKKELKSVKKRELIIGKGLLKLFHDNGWVNKKKRK